MKIKVSRFGDTAVRCEFEDGRKLFIDTGFVLDVNSFRVQLDEYLQENDKIGIFDVDLIED